MHILETSTSTENKMGTVYRTIYKRDTLKCHPAYEEMFKLITNQKNAK